MTQHPKQGNPWKQLDGPNLAYVLDMYEQYQQDPDSVDQSLIESFEQWGPPLETSGAEEQHVIAAGGIDPYKLVQTMKLIENIRTYGHLAADIYPVGDFPKDEHYIDLKEYGLTQQDLESIPARLVWTKAPAADATAWDAIQRLKKAYTRSIAYEFSHVHQEEEREWLFDMAEKGKVFQKRSAAEKQQLLYRLTEVDGFEKFLHKTFVGQKRFSIEGVDMLVPMLDEAVRESAVDNVEHVMIGMAHRGRLSVLAHVLGKPLELIFSEFHHSPNKELFPSEGSRGINFGWTGDVKYHLGANRVITEENQKQIRVHLANNPSHLEFVDPVVEGYARAAQDDRTKAGYPAQDTNKALAVLIHGDAAFPGEGVVAETLNISGLKGYHTGGTIHIIANNLIGFTTDSSDSRSTRYASDLAKGYEIPVIHVNADDPEACLDAVYFACEYRKTFNKDVLIDLIGYRRYGHNEMDDPMGTQPALYTLINKYPNVKQIYADKLVEAGLVTKEETERFEKEVLEKHQKEYDKVKDRKEKFELEDTVLPEQLSKDFPPVDTAVSEEDLAAITEDMLSWPENFTVYPKLQKILERRRDAFTDGKGLDWGTAEALAFAAILKDGTPIRLTGQDSERGTFSQRHLVLKDSKTGEKYSPLHKLSGNLASFALFNSPLSEAAVVGFEYGYNVFAPETLVLWEAQYGDFANAAQVLFDQFVSAGRAKWGQKSGLVLLLPHGYEGQGPEHSSARLERFLQLSAENNWTVANVTSAAQYFHLLRRQAKLLEHDEIRPLVVMTPKSLLRHPKVSSSPAEFAEGTFKTAYAALDVKEKEKVTKMVMSSGKVGVDLDVAISQSGEDTSHLQVVRVEQLYPFPYAEIKKILNEYPNVEEVCWVQEEPQNMGPWTFMEPRLWDLVPEGVLVSYIGRPDRSSPSGGEPDIHKQEQERIVAIALEKPEESKGGHDHVRS
ncbi:2-oxoglutarate dehydrogenase E1 component [Fictibacillus aquaticus]|uniref:2-oxoglutarate dehydrogenase E1 component n=1 Tax=Fictibacillus aquaticus TaxID=2021314 RepID=A0A235FBE9_9BACL|nr:2-oxoglutarate dehydrogenase E1 component [Fictibacillus aquaticus]OYD58651.1 2-oxoglutarate dehydrogenase E1 component [Fictibacillus aquaticus]